MKHAAHGGCPRWLLALLTLAFCCAGATAQPIRVGSKNFTEQEILGELVAQLIERTTELDVERRFGLGGTDICHAALLAGEIDLYVEYTGTGLVTVLKREVIANPNRAYLAVAEAYREQFGLVWLPPIGFNNTYAITVREAQAQRQGWANVSDLQQAAPELTAGFTAEFMERPDGYPGVRGTYGFSFGNSVDLDPGLMYEALAGGQVDVICAFATDGRIAEFDLRTLEDDAGFFPPYDACPVVRAETLAEFPQIRRALALLAGAIDDEQMREMNRAVDVDRRPPAEVARAWIDARLPRGVAASASVEAEAAGFFGLAYQRRAELWQKVVEHLVLTFLGASIAIVIGVPLGVLIHRRAAARGPVLAGTEIVQTIPSLAMLAFLFAIYGLLGPAPAVTALVLYALLPIVLNTYTGLREVPEQVITAADGVGMTKAQRLRIVELPLAAPVIIAGVRAATVLTVGIATLSTYIGAGGLGDFIARGLARNDTRLTLLGALPAAIMAVTLSLAIRLLERRFERR
jgi:osmoprotectant transport system permease protein